MHEFDSYNIDRRFVNEFQENARKHKQKQRIKVLVGACIALALTYGLACYFWLSTIIRAILDTN